MKTFLGLLCLLLCTAGTLTAPLSTGKVLLVEPSTIYYHASFVRSTMTLTYSNKVMRFPTGGTSYEELIIVPLGVLDPHAVIRVTVAMRPDSTNRDPHFGLTDGVTENRFRVSDSNGQCQMQAGSYISASQPYDSEQHYEYVFLFEPFHKYGACSYLGGHINPGYFSYRIDPTKGLSFVVKRENTNEDYEFYYFLIEVL